MSFIPFFSCLLYKELLLLSPLPNLLFWYIANWLKAKKERMVSALCLSDINIFHGKFNLDILNLYWFLLRNQYYASKKTFNRVSIIVHNIFFGAIYVFYFFTFSIIKFFVYSYSRWINKWNAIISVMPASEELYIIEKHPKHDLNTNKIYF